MNIITHDSHLEIKNLSASGVFTGYGSVYDMADEGDDVVAQGAFTDSLSTWRAKGALPALLWQHKASEPVGSYTRMSEDSHGLALEGQLMMKTPLGQYAYEALKTKAVSGLSVGFITREDTMDRKTGVRTIKRADLWEVSIVTFPMNDAARVDSVKSVPKFSTLSEFERYLRDVFNATKSDARAIVSEAKTMLRRDAGSVDISQSILKALSRRAALLTVKADSEVDEPPGPDPDDNCNLTAGCCMPDECCNSMGCCMAKAIGAMGPMP